jgi:hypothetical protein
MSAVDMSTFVTEPKIEISMQAFEDAIRDKPAIKESTEKKKNKRFWEKKLN